MVLNLARNVRGEDGRARLLMLIKSYRDQINHDLTRSEYRESSDENRATSTKKQATSEMVFELNCIPQSFSERLLSHLYHRHGQRRAVLLQKILSP